VLQHTCDTDGSSDSSCDSSCDSSRDSSCNSNIIWIPGQRAREKRQRHCHAAGSSTYHRQACCCLCGPYWFESQAQWSLTHLLLPPLLRAALAGVTAVLSMLPSTDHVADAYEGVSAAPGHSRLWIGNRQQAALEPEPTASSIMHQLQHFTDAAGLCNCRSSLVASGGRWQHAAPGRSNNTTEMLLHAWAAVAVRH
jgi:hypothetical protein